MLVKESGPVLSEAVAKVAAMPRSQANHLIHIGDRFRGVHPVNAGLVLKVTSDRVGEGRVAVMRPDGSQQGFPAAALLDPRFFERVDRPQALL